ncbi:hypothetical protein CEJ39_16965 [Rhodococcus pyridinivorans]|uniref:hypothetical protein n=1 Tax=Rhodococcus pyridinivorans TaxID=103816 RepID=UPI00057109A2|nr:hypothetical protein [Rhodococcus pyridinivorans]AWZ25635.1 hypothetical protein CEJ39_16965 [Rhodococcus pyridinivorans]
MTPRTETQEFTVVGPRRRFRGLALTREADEIAGIRARQAGATEWTYELARSMHTGGPDEEIEHHYVLYLAFD